MTDKWIKELCYLHTVEYYSAIKDEILPFEITWIDPVKLVKKKISDLRLQRWKIGKQDLDEGGQKVRTSSFKTNKY